MKLIKIYFLFFIIIPFNNNLCQDTVFVSKNIQRNHSATYAAVMSTVIPGLGQIYNNKVWKVPVLYGGAGVSVYFLNYYQKRYDAVKSILKGIGEDGNPILNSYNIYGRIIPYSNIERAKRNFGNFRDYNILILAGLYVLNIIDAAVDAYMFEYDISDDLSLEIKPDVIPSGLNYGTPGLTLSFNF